MRLGQSFSAGVILFPRGHWTMFGGIFVCQLLRRGVVIGIWWAEARGAVEHPTVPWTVPTTKNKEAQNVMVPRVRNPQIDTTSDSYAAQRGGEVSSEAVCRLPGHPHPRPRLL